MVARWLLGLNNIALLVKRIINVKILKWVKVGVLWVDSLQLHLNVVSHWNWLTSNGPLALDVLSWNRCIVLLNFCHLVPQHLLRGNVIPRWSWILLSVWWAALELTCVAEVETHQLAFCRRLILVLETRFNNSALLLDPLFAWDVVYRILKIFLDTTILALESSWDTLIVLLWNTLSLFLLASLLCLFIWTIMNVAVITTDSHNPKGLNLHLIWIRLCWVRGINLLWQGMLGMIVRKIWNGLACGLVILVSLVLVRLYQACHWLCWDLCAKLRFCLLLLLLTLIVHYCWLVA